ncbi:hypothetical protein HK101_002409, partial [Irineochytrium annulatum]
MTLTRTILLLAPFVANSLQQASPTFISFSQTPLPTPLKWLDDKSAETFFDQIAPQTGDDGSGNTGDWCLLNECTGPGSFINTLFLNCNSTVTSLLPNAPPTGADVGKLMAKCLCGISDPTQPSSPAQIALYTQWNNCKSCYDTSYGTARATGVDFHKACLCADPGPIQALVNLGNKDFVCNKYLVDRNGVGAVQPQLNPTNTTAGASKTQQPLFQNPTPNTPQPTSAAVQSSAAVASATTSAAPQASSAAAPPPAPAVTVPAAATSSAGAPPASPLSPTTEAEVATLMTENQSLKDQVAEAQKENASLNQSMKELKRDQDARGMGFEVNIRELRKTKDGQETDLSGADGKTTASLPEEVMTRINEMLGPKGNTEGLKSLVKDLAERCMVQEAKIKKMAFELEMECGHVNILRAENQALKKAQVTLQAEAEREEEFITNRLMQRINNLKKEKGELLMKVEIEEEQITNTLQRKLSQLQKEKIEMEQALEQEQEFIGG